MLDKNNEVLFGEYCKTCKYERYSETDSPCAECLAEPVNLYSRKPVKWEGADGIYAGPPPRPDHAYQRAVKYVPENRKDREKAIARHNIDAEYTGNKVQTIDDKVTDDQYPSATAVKKALEGANEVTAQSLARKIDAPDTCECGEFLAVEEVNEDGVVTKVKGAKVQTDPPDWSENDPTKPGYVKNRPGGYTKTVTETKTIIVEAGTQLSPADASDLNLFPSFAVGDIVDITVNGTKYSLTAYNPEGAPPTVALIGDMLPPPENPEYGWSLWDIEGAISFGNHTNDEMLVQFDISREETVTIDPKYLPSVKPEDIKDMYYTAVEEIDLAGYTLTNVNYEGDHDDVYPFELGQVWNATGQNINYTNLEVKQADDGTLYIGDLNRSDPPFFISTTSGGALSDWLNRGNPGSMNLVGVSGKVTTENIHKIYDKYIPDSVAYKDQLPAMAIMELGVSDTVMQTDISINDAYDSALVIVKTNNSKVPSLLSVRIHYKNDTYYKRINNALTGSEVKSADIPYVMFLYIDMNHYGRSWLLNPVVATTEKMDVIIPSNSYDSTKKFKITVNDSGTISATEVKA